MMDAQLLKAAEQTVTSLTHMGRTLTTAESCTGGLIAAVITEIPGASRVFRYGWVTYCNEAKERLLSVPMVLVEKYTVVSEPVVLSMASGARERSGADYALAVSGNAGPTAADGEPPVGTVCIALATPTGEHAETFFFSDLSRTDFRREVVRRALSMLLRELSEPS